MLIKQISKDLNRNTFLERERIVRKSCEKHMRLGLTGTIITTKNAYKKNYNKKLTHIGMYLNNKIAIKILEEKISIHFHLNEKIKIFIIVKDSAKEEE